MQFQGINQIPVITKKLIKVNEIFHGKCFQRAILMNIKTKNVKDKCEIIKTKEDIYGTYNKGININSGQY